MPVDLSIVGMPLRKEHLPGAIESAGEDGHGIVEDFLCASPLTRDEINRGGSSACIEGLPSRYPSPNFPVWAFMEVISVGAFRPFYKFRAGRADNGDTRSRYYLLMEVKNLRNACAHNNCVINDPSTKGPPVNWGHTLTQELARIRGIGKSQRCHKMINRLAGQVVIVLCPRGTMAPEGVRSCAAQSPDVSVKRMSKYEYVSTEGRTPSRRRSSSSLVLWRLGIRWAKARRPRDDKAEGLGKIPLLQKRDAFCKGGSDSIGHPLVFLRDKWRTMRPSHPPAFGKLIE